ncbi:MAG: TonB-dependent receptor, partial [Pseudomonadota bacterium]|nr:TonB-dependent receptor [Pseudomonadota bacterium]
FMVGGDWQLTNAGHVSSNSLASDEERETFFGRVSWALTPEVEVFGQASMSEFSGASFYQQTPSTGVTIRNDNAYLPANIREQMATLGLASIAIGTSNAGIPPAGSDNTRKVTRLVVGADGAIDMFGSSWDWGLYYQNGVADTDEALTNTWNNSRMALAQDAVFSPSGDIVCRSTLTNPTNGCVPINRVGIGGVTQEAIDYIMGPARPYRSQKLEQNVAAINFSNAELFNGPAGPVSFATGLEWRKEEIGGSVDPIHNSGWLYGNYVVTSGEYDVVEGYIETIVPLHETVEFNGAMRWTDYELSGQVETWKVGFTWQPIQDVRMRVTQSKDIRAPNLSELFAAGTARTNTVNLFPSNAAAQFVENTSGNLSLTPEEADSLGVGFVLSPRFLPDLTMSVDYYKISMEDNISTINAQNTANLCLQQGIQEFCNNLIYDGSGTLQQINLNPVNFASLEAKGLDFEASYLMTIGPVDVTLRGMATRYIDSTSDNGINLPSNDAGTISLPGWTYRLSTSLAMGPMKANLIYRGFTDTVYNTLWIECTTNCPISGPDIKTINDNDIDGAYYIDASFSYNLPVSSGEAEAFLYFNNLLNTDPVPYGNGPTGNNTPAYPQTSRTQFDTFGRVMRVGVRASF